MTPAKGDASFERLLTYLLEARGFDFRGYKRTSLERRVRKRMGQVGLDDFDTYLDYLRDHDNEFGVLFNTILINVTSYFRDAEAWHFLRKEILPRLISAKARYESVRVWCPGAASGEEAYTIAMLLCDALGSEEYRDRTKIYATDVDEEALNQARLGRAEADQLEEVPVDFREKYFEQVGNRYVFRGDLRRTIIFGRHDLVHDAPISRIDLLICRNTLMYFDSATQGKILGRLHYALNDAGFLFLGKAEMLLTRDALFLPVDLKQRVFTKVLKPQARERLPVVAPVGSGDRTNREGLEERLREAAADGLPIAQIVIDTRGVLALANDRARSVFGIAHGDLGRPLQDLEVSYRPLELRSRIELAYRDRHAVTVRDIERRIDDSDSQYLDIEVMPLLDADGGLLGASISFADVTPYNRLTREVERTKHELETASEELHATNEELETTNEELQSTVEELETTNEELQSSNEELETMNEELESTNSELQAINTELQKRSVQLDDLNVFLQQIMATVHVGVAVLDKDLKVQLWNKRAEDLWGIRSDEAVDQPLLGLDIGLPMAEITAPIRRSLVDADGHQQIEVQATNRRGRRFMLRMQATAMRDVNGARGVILLMEAVDPAAEIKAGS